MDKHRIALRAEASPAIGLGHLRRMMDLAQALAERGAIPLFACTADSRQVLIERGIRPEMIVLVGTISDWTDTQRITRIVTDLQFPGNATQAAHEVAALCATGIPVTVIDSMPPDHFQTVADSIPPACVVTPYVGAETLRPAPETQDWATGASFAILEESYTAARNALDPATPLPRRLLVSCGGSDPSGLSLRIARTLAATGLHTDLILGPLFAPAMLHDLQTLAQDTPTLHLHPAQPGLAPMIRDAGLVAGRVGLLRYQAAVLGRPGIYLHEGPAYRAYLETFAAQGLAEIFFADPPYGEALFLNRLAALADPGQQAHVFTLNRAALTAVDGQGALRVADRVLAQTKE